MGKKDAYLYNNYAFQKSIGRIEIFSNSGASTNVSVAVNFSASSACSSSYTTGAQTLSTANAVYTFAPSILNATYFRVEVTNAYNAQIQIKVVFRIATTSVDVSPSSVTLAPGQTRQLSTTVLPGTTTDALIYSSNLTSVATVSNSGLITAIADGTATITATSGTFSDTCVVTVETPEEPFINPSKASTSGFTGQNETITFTYGNLTSTLSVVSNNESVVSIDSLSYDAGSGSVRFNFDGVGSTTVLFKDGSTTVESVSVSVTLSSVSIIGLAANSSVDVGQNINLGSTITVTPTGSCSSAVTWSSNDNSVATVSSSGVVTGVTPGVVNITVTSNDFPSANMTCAMTVFEKIDFPNDAYNIAKPESAESELSTALVGNYTLNTLNAYHVTPSHTYMMFGNKDLTTTNTLVSNKTPTPAPITKIVFTIKAGSSADAVYNAMLSSSEVTSKVTDETYTCTGPGSITITASEVANLRYFAISDVAENKNGQLEKIEICYSKPTASEVINSTSTKPTLAYKYTNNGSLAFTGVAIRFSGLISKAVWDELDAASSIQGYGILFATADLGSDSIEDYYDLAKDDHTIDEALIELCDGGSPIARNFYHSVAEAMPDAANTSQKEGLLENYYVWNLFKNVPTASDSDFIVDYTAVAYIRTSTEIIFFDEATASASSLAHDLMASGEYADDYLEGSLKYLADLLP